MKNSSTLNRRSFLKVTSIMGTGLVLSLYLPGCSQDQTPLPSPQKTPTKLATLTLDVPSFFKPNVYITIGTDGTITLTCPRPDMGQGTRTALPMILAEELGADWSSIRVIQADADQVYGNQLTGGSSSIRNYYTTLRYAGAIARKMFIAAAAQIWSVPPESCFAENSIVTNKETMETLSYKDLVETVMTYDPINFQPIELKNPADFSIIGTPVPRVDSTDIVTGKAIYGMDVKVPGMIFAVAARSPVLGGKLVSFDDSQARSIPGVIDVIEITSGMNGINPNKSVAVLASDTWSAIRGREALNITWDDGTKVNLNSIDIEQQLLKDATSPPKDGELVAYYTVPFLSHSPMEPINNLTKVEGQQCEIWVPTQSPQDIQNFIVSTYNIPVSDTHVHIPLVGGGFGRRLELPDDNQRMPAFHITESYELSATAGKPIHLIWTREDDMHYEYYHPMSVTRVSAKLDDIGTLSARRVEANDYGIPTGAWRAVTNVPEAFAHESFLDEFAIATDQDPVELHLKILGDRAKAVLNLAVEQSGWGSSLPSRYGRGIAIHSTWNVSPCAQVAEVMVDESGKVHVLKVTCVIDCGVVINPNIVKAQMEGGILFGLTSTLKAYISIENGRIKQSNFDDYPILRMDEIPEINVFIIDSEVEPTGVGEMANPPIAAAVANAIYAATGKRVRRLPIFPEDITAS